MNQRQTTRFAAGPLRTLSGLLTLALALVVLLGLRAAWQAQGQEQGVETQQLVPGRPFKGEMDLLAEPLRTFAVRVPPNAKAMRIDVSQTPLEFYMEGNVVFRTGNFQAGVNAVLRHFKRPVRCF